MWQGFLDCPATGEVISLADSRIMGYFESLIWRMDAGTGEAGSAAYTLH